MAFHHRYLWTLLKTEKCTDISPTDKNTRIIKQFCQAQGCSPIVQKSAHHQQLNEGSVKIYNGPKYNTMYNGSLALSKVIKPQLQ